MVSQENFPSLDLALATLEDRGVDTEFDAIRKADNPVLTTTALRL